MSLWSKIKSSVGLGDPEPAAAPAQPPVDPEFDAAQQEVSRMFGGEVPDALTDAERAAGKAASVAAAKAHGPTEIEALAKTGQADGPTADEALQILRRSRGTQDEASALAAALTIENPPSVVRVATAEMLAERGEEDRAIDVLTGETSTEGLLLIADLHANRGDLPRAIGAIERVLARRIDAPGARERHARWSRSLGVATRARPKVDEATVLNAKAVQGPFRILREVARGGAGTVYEAADDVLGRRVAFKVYHGQGSDRALVEREVRLIERFRGDGVARVFDASLDEGWIALEWVPRGSLRDLLRTGHVDALMPLGRWARPLAKALSRVHREGWVHADVKPANVLLREADDAILTDFGISRVAGESSSGGSPGYLSPERLGGEKASALDDVYGYGRIIEDVLQAVAARADAAPADLEPWWRVVRSCLGPPTHRPMDGSQLRSLTEALV